MLSKNKLLVIVATVIIVIGCVLYFNRFEINDEFVLTTQTVKKHKLTENLRVKALIFNVGFNNAIVLGNLVIEGKKYPFEFGSLINSSNQKDNYVYRLTCKANKTKKYMLNRYVFIRVNDSGAIINLELIEAVTYYENSRTESELAGYVPAK
jgi:hypothetical protein